MSKRLAGGVAVLVMAVSMLAACGEDDTGDEAGGSPTPTTASTTATTSASAVAGRPVSVVSPASGSSLGGNVVMLDVEAAGFPIVKADGDRSGNTGHYHVFVDRDPVPAGAPIPREPGIIHTTEDPIAVTGLSPGKHRLTVVLGNGAHERIGESAGSTEVTLTGPSVKASAPASVPAGQAVNISVKVEGITLVKADGDTSGKTGHLHLFIDKPPAAPKEAVPTGDPKIIHTAETSVAVPDLPPGEHTIWVVVGDGAHVALDPPVRDRLTVNVT